MRRFILRSAQRAYLHNSAVVLGTPLHLNVKDMLQSHDQGHAWGPLSNAIIGFRLVAQVCACVSVCEYVDR